MIRKKHLKIFSALISLCILLSPISSYADFMDDMEEQKLLPVQSNEWPNWPAGPQVGAYSAILMDVDTGAILYDKNSHTEMFPASTTKMLTCLLALEKEGSNLNDLVYFSKEAVESVTLDASNMGLNVGNKMTLEECLYGILVASANEISNAVAEYTTGDIPSFVKLMNERAKEIGCLNTHFNNVHGYTDPNHYSSAYDLALIGKEFFSNELLAKMSRTPSYHWYPTEYQPDDMQLGSTNYFLKGRKYCEGLVGSKTGFTDESRCVLVTCAERNGMRLIAVVMQEENPYQYDDTNTLLDYGFSNFERVKVSDYETKYIITDETFFHSDSSVFGDSSSILSLDTNAYITLPKTTSFNNLTSTLTLNKEENSDTIATITYRYNNVFLGNADILFSQKAETSFVFDETEPEIVSEESEEKEPVFIYINYVIYAIIGLFVLVVIIAILHKILATYHFAERRKASRRFRKRKITHGPSFKAYKNIKEKKVKKKKRSSSYIDL